MNKEDVLVCISRNSIIVSHDGKKLIIDKDTKMFNEMNGLKKDQIEEKIREWYVSKH